MERITANTLTTIGFEPLTVGGRIQETGEWGQVPTGEYSLNTLSPPPVIDPSQDRKNARIGSLQFTVTTQAELDRFLEKVVPAFCEFI